MSKIIKFDDLIPIWADMLDHRRKSPRLKLKAFDDNREIIGVMVNYTNPADNDPEIASIDIDADDGREWMIYQTEVNPDELELLD
ncbi:hypothetical protein [Weissella minor]|uniref:hypothetical protein n=1 Tax=Weissella minor TaxID=1620 RepID=UPI00070BD258|nr:hypothetical protein [Weissella minor]